MQKGEHVKDNQAKRSNVEVTSIVVGRLLSCVRRVLSYTWHWERNVELLVMYDQTVCVCVGVCVCQNEKESARRMASTTSENCKRNEKKSTEQEEAHFVSRVTVILTTEKERDYLLNLHMSKSTCFGT